MENLQHWFLTLIWQMQIHWARTLKLALFRSSSSRTFLQLECWKTARFRSIWLRMGDWFFHQVWSCTRQTVRRLVVLAQRMNKYKTLRRTHQNICLQKPRTLQTGSSQPVWIVKIVMLKSADTLGSRVMVKAVSWHPRLECLKIYFITNLRSSAVIFVRTVSCYPHVLASYFIVVVVVVLLLKFHLVQICTNFDVVFDDFSTDA